GGGVGVGVGGGVGVGLGVGDGVGVGVGFGFRRPIAVAATVEASLTPSPAIANRPATKTAKNSEPRMRAKFAIGFSLHYPHPRASGFLHRLRPEAIHLGAGHLNSLDH